MDFAGLHEILMKKLDFSAYFTQAGVEATGEVASDGWVDCASCFSPGRKMRVNVKNGAWTDEVFQIDEGSIYDFVIRRNGLENNDTVKALQVLCTFAGLEKQFAACNAPDPAGPGAVEPISRDVIDFWRKALAVPANRENLERLTGLNVKTATQYNIGWIAPRFTKTEHGAFIVPVADWDGIYRSARLIDEKISSRWAPRGLHRMPKTDQSPKLFGVEDIFREDWKTIIVCQNEFDRLMIMQERQRGDWGSVSLTDNNYLRHWDKYFKDRNVVICFHTDRKSRNYAECVLAPLIKLEKDRGNVVSLRLITMPTAGIDSDKSVCDWFRAGGNWQTFERMVETAPEWIPPNASKELKDCKILKSFSEIDDPINTDIKVQVPLCISGETNIVYDSPTEFEVKFCSDIQSGKCELCRDKTFPIDIGKAEHIAASNSSEANWEKMCRNICCPFEKRPKINILQKATFREVIACQYYDRIVDREGEDGKLNTRIDGRYEQLTERRIYIRIPEGRAEPLEPRGYMAIGWVRTNPKNSNRTLLVESLTPLEEGYEAFKHREHIEELTKLRALGWRGIVDDLTKNVTMIFGYDELLLITLLTYCSPLYIKFNGERIRGWLTAAVIGDSGVGKSKVFERISEFVGVGDVFSCLSGRRTGLAYAVVKTSSQWRCQSGLQPRNTRKILCVEEAQDMPQRDMKSIAIAMDTGRLDVDQVARGSYETRTRLIFNCNPAVDRTLGSYAYGCLSMRDLFSHMFIRRIDIAAFVRKMDTNDHYNRKFDETSEPKLCPSDLRALVYFAWNLSPERILISDQVTDLILNKSKHLSAVYGGCDDIPLVCPSDFRKTLARLAVAWAVLDLSGSEDFEHVEVKIDHVNFACMLICNLYSNPDCGLEQYSEKSKRMNRLEDYSLIETEIKARISRNGREAFQGMAPFPRLLFILDRGLRYTKAELKRLLNAGDLFIGEALNFLSGNHLVTMDQDEKVYTTPKYNRFMKRFKEANPEQAALINLSADHVEMATEEERETVNGED